jgi:hypothetical protein
VRWAGEDQGARQRPAGLEDLGVGKAQHDYWAAQGDAEPFIYVQGLGFRWRKALIYVLQWCLVAMEYRIRILCIPARIKSIYFLFESKRLESNSMIWRELISLSADFRSDSSHMCR